jgi:hypothetical protein
MPVQPRNNIWVVLLLVFVVDCSERREPPNYGEMENLLLSNIDDFEYLSSFIRQKGLSRITHDSIYPKGKIDERELTKYRELLSRLGIYTGVQYHNDDAYVEVLYWSSGILDRGEAMIFIRTEKSISEIPYLKDQIDEKDLSCDIIDKTGKWYICDR